MAENTQPKAKTVSDTDESAREVAEKNYAVKGNDLSGFRGVSPEYMTYASETEKPVAKKDDKKKGEPKQADSKPSSSKPSAPSAPSAPSSQSGQRQS